MTDTLALLPVTIRGVNLPTYAIGFDWVQYSGTIKPGQFPQIKSEKYALNLKDYGTRNFNQLFEVVTINAEGIEEICAFIESRPRVKFIAGNVVLVKLDNKYCYNSDLQNFVTQLNTELGIEFKNFTRLDTFIDFQFVGDNIDPQNFLRACASRTLVVRGKSMRTHHERKIITGITWGSASSYVSFTMYNKSREMRKKVQKPWVNELWRICGFDEMADTYRLEFRHKKDSKTFVDTCTGETLFSHTDVTILSSLNDYITSLYEQHFYVAKYEPGIRISRMQRYYPLDMAATLVKPIRLTEKLKSNNYIKYLIKSMLESGMLYQKKGDKIKASSIFEHIEYKLQLHDLWCWFKMRYPQVNIYQHHMTIFDIASCDLAKTHFIKQSEFSLN